MTYRACVPVLLLISILGIARLTAANTITLAQNGTLQVAAGVNDIMLRGELDGLVTATFADNSTQTLAWSGSGVTGSNWGLNILLNIQHVVRTLAGVQHERPRHHEDRDGRGPDQRGV